MNRITSRLYAIVGIAYIFTSAVLLNSLFGGKGAPLMKIAIVGIEILLIAQIWAFLNFIDIYRSDDGRLEFHFWGNRLVMSRIIRIGKLPVIARTSSRRYFVAFIRFVDDKDKKRLKFFMIAKRSWDYVTYGKPTRGYS
ncbi:MAG: hypothetical protein JST42_01180 [Bacteroidetes bacterium]|nr:hypothetical protein [Bacteroidota bacterium]